MSFELEVRNSQIKEAGDGLFVKSGTIDADQVVCEYTGDMVVGHDNLSYAQSDIAVGVGGDILIVGNGIGAKVNDIAYMTAVSEEEFEKFVRTETYPTYPSYSTNCKFEIKGSGEFARVYIKAIRKIETDEELFISYGSEYWIQRLIRWKLIDEDYAKKTVARLVWEKIQTQNTIKNK